MFELLLLVSWSRINNDRENFIIFCIFWCSMWTTIFLFFNPILFSLEPSLSSVLNSSSVTDAPLKVGLGVGFDKSIDGTNSSLWGMIGGSCMHWWSVSWSVPSHSEHRLLWKIFVMRFFWIFFPSWLLSPSTPSSRIKILPALAQAMKKKAST